MDATSSAETVERLHLALDLFAYVVIVAAVMLLGPVLF